MKLLGKKPDHPFGLPESGVTGRQLTAIAIAFAVAILLMPVGAKAAALLNVFVTNDSSNPVPVNQADNPAFQPVQVDKTRQSSDNPLDLSLYTVPAGKRLVVEWVSGTWVGDSSVHAYFLLRQGTGFEPLLAVLGGEPQPFAGSTRWFASGPLHAYVDAGKTVLMQVSLDGTSAALPNGSASLSGYLVDIP
jgi:hypothetical protein